MNKPRARADRLRLSEQRHRLFDLTEEEVAFAQGRVCKAVERTELQRFFGVKNTRLGLPPEHKGRGQLLNCPRVVPIEGYRRLELGLRLRLPVLDLAELPHRRVRH